MSTDKSAAAMKASEALREFISKYVNNNNEPTFLPDLTALISEHYYPKEFVRWKDNHYHCVASLYWEKQPEGSDKTFRQIPHFTIDELYNYWANNEQ